MLPARKVCRFRREGDNWLCNVSLPSDLTVVVNEVKFHLHKFPIISRCGKIATIVEESQSTSQKTFNVSLEEFPGGADIFLTVVKFCYGSRVEFTPRNVVILYCAADYLEMTDYYGEDNLLSKLESFFHSHILKHWKDCILALQSSDRVIVQADKLQILSRCITALSVMICTDPSLFGWPLKMYGSLQSPGGSILWNGINTGAKIHCEDSDWWFEDISHLSVELFQRVVQTMEAKGMNPNILARAIMYYCRKYLPGLGRWHGGGQSGGTARTVASFGTAPATVVDQRALLETVINLLPEKRGKSLCRFLLGLLRVALIMGVNHRVQDSLERRIGVQLELATLDSLLIPSYSDSDTLYVSDCVERMIRHFVSSELNLSPVSPPSSGRLRRVSKLVDDYLAEVASDVNLKPGKFRVLAEALPDSARSLNDGLYRAMDIFLKARPWLSEKEREQLCNVIDFRKLSIDACTHASQNEMLPLRVILQVLFFEQMQLRTALAGCVNVVDSETVPPPADPSGITGQVPRTVRDPPVMAAPQSSVLKADMERMMSRVWELEQEFRRMNEQMKRMNTPRGQAGSPRFSIRRIGCKLLPRSSDAKQDVIESTVHTPTPRASFEQAQAQPSNLSYNHRPSSSSPSRVSAWKR